MAIDFIEYTRPLIGKPIAHAWKGIGSAIFLEVGELSTPPGHNNASGEHCIAIEWDWRVENGQNVLFGSSNTSPVIADRINELHGAEISSIICSGEIPELLVFLSNGYRIRTSVMVSGDPKWSIRIWKNKNKWLYVTDGKLNQGNGIANSTPEETDASNRESETAKRWGRADSQPVLGNCMKCINFIRLNGQANLLDYGACTAPASPFDGKTVHRRSGCPNFEASNG